MKIGVVTFWGGYNYGSILQGYALQRVLKDEFNADAEILKIGGEAISTHPKSIFHYLCNPWRKIGIRIRRQKSIKKGYKNITKFQAAYENNKNNFKAFEQQIRYSSLISSRQQLLDCNEVYDLFIAGSDQIWNPSILKGCYFLDFVTDTAKKVSYAASLGTDDIPFYSKNYFIKLLCGFKFISVREKKSVNMLAKLLETEVCHVLDPTMLLTNQQWAEQAEYRYVPDEDYLLCYFLSDNSACYREAEKYAFSRGLKIVSIVAGVSGGYDINGAIIIPEAGPKDFIGLMEKATCVMTNSFHCTVFSIIFEKDFYCFAGITYNSVTSINYRYCDLLDLFGISDRFVGNDLMGKEQSIEPIDYNIVNLRLEQLKQESIDFLRKAIEV